MAPTQPTAPYILYLLQVRVVIQNAKGQVHEDELMGVVTTRDSHHVSKHRSVSMDMTLVESMASESIACAIPEQVCLLPITFTQLNMK